MRESLSAFAVAMLSMSSIVAAQATMPSVATSFGSSASAHPLRVGRYAMTLSSSTSVGCSQSYEESSVRTTSILTVTRDAASLCLRANKTRLFSSRSETPWPNPTRTDYAIGVGYRGSWRNDHGVAHFTLTPDASVCGAATPDPAIYQPISFDCIEVRGHAFQRTVSTPLIACRKQTTPLPAPFDFDDFAAVPTANTERWMMLSLGNGLSLTAHQGMWEPAEPLVVTTNSAPITP